MKAVKRMPIMYKQKGNEEQAVFIAKVEETIIEVELQLAKTRPSPAVEHARDALSRGKMLLLEREKLIKIADRSEFSWGVVAEYMAYELVEDSNDEKRLEKAEKAAEQKAVKQKRKHTVMSVKLQKPRFTTGPAPSAASTQVGPLQCSNLGG